MEIASYRLNNSRDGSPPPADPPRGRRGGEEADEREDDVAESSGDEATGESFAATLRRLQAQEQLGEHAETGRGVAPPSPELAPAPSGLPTAAGLRGLANSGGHHEDESVTQPAQHDVFAMQTRLRQMLTAALIKSADVRAHTLEWIAAVCQANVHAQMEAAAAGPEQAMRMGSKVSGEGTLLNLATVMLQLCEPFLTPGRAA